VPNSTRFRRLLLFALIAATVLALVLPLWASGPLQRQGEFLPPGANGSRWFLLGSDYLGRPFLRVLADAARSSLTIAVGGSLAVMGLALALGILQGSTRSRLLEGLLAAGTLGVLALPEAAVLITLASAWPRQAAAWQVNLSMIAILVLFAAPTGARLIAERVRCVNRAGFVEASRACGATYLHTFRKDVLPHLREDLAWILAAVIPRFIAVEVGLAYLGVEYRDFEGLGRLLKKSFDYLGVGVALLQLVVTLAIVVWLALLPQVVALLLRSVEGEEESESASEATPAPPESRPLAPDVLLSVRHLSVVADDTGREVLSRVDFDLPRGQVVVVLGESGSGKSSLVNCILNLLPEGLVIEEGEVLFAENTGGTDLEALSAGQRRRLARTAFGYVPQDPGSGLDPRCRAIDIVAEAAALAPDLEPAPAVRVRAAFAAAGLPEKFLEKDAYRRPGRLSGGQRQRVAIAQAIVNRPRLLLMDEPTSALDPLARREVLGTVRSLVAGGTTVLLVTHDVGSAARVADRVVVMYRGRVVESGPAAVVLGNPAHSYTKALLGCVPRVEALVPLHPVDEQGEACHVA
jgi:ABC-type dipeptide/oligopeptide/nickel transport system ATPase component/ABC-type dipeptide/oligopeptide/nickel transport system permease subunit